MIHVTNYYDAASKADEVSATHLISVLGPGAYIKRPPRIIPSNHLTLSFHDIAEPTDGEVGPTSEDIKRLLDFAKMWDGGGPLVVHCNAGVSRSPAVALIIMAQFNPGKEFEAARVLRSLIPHARPNRWMVNIADDVMACEGRLIMATEVSRGPSAISSASLSLPLKL